MVVLLVIVISFINGFYGMTRYVGTIMNKLEENYLLNDPDNRDVKLNEKLVPKFIFSFSDYK